MITHHSLKKRPALIRDVLLSAEEQWTREVQIQSYSRTEQLVIAEDNTISTFRLNLSLSYIFKLDNPHYYRRGHNQTMHVR